MLNYRQSHVLVRYAEIGIKGNNRSEFETQLTRNIRSCLDAHKIPFDHVVRSSGRIIITTKSDCSVLKEVFGIASWSSAINTGKTIKELFDVVKEHVQLENKTFKVACTRVDKRFPIDSMTINCQLGELLCQATGASVKMKTPDIIVQCEVVEQTLFYCTSTEQGLGGLPVGSSSQVLVLAQTNDDLAAARAMLKRGCTILLATDNTTAIEQILHFSHGHEIKIIPSSQAKEASTKTLLAIVPDICTNIKEYDLSCPIVRPLIGGNVLEKISCEKSLTITPNN
ncbi:MAG: THUMP domain-containing protein [Candidatus Woesearchaeota archaeon]|nr:THUMP domain-containing protein [Candidatus Woesearchaeota archaeon]